MTVLEFYNSFKHLIEDNIYLNYRFSIDVDENRFNFSDTNTTLRNAVNLTRNVEEYRLEADKIISLNHKASINIHYSTNFIKMYDTLNRSIKIENFLQND